MHDVLMCLCLSVTCLHTSLIAPSAATFLHMLLLLCLTLAVVLLQAGLYRPCSTGILMSSMVSVQMSREFCEVVNLQQYPSLSNLAAEAFCSLSLEFCKGVQAAMRPQPVSELTVTWGYKPFMQTACCCCCT